MIYRVKIDFGYHNMVFDYKSADDAMRLAIDIFNHYSVDNTRDATVCIVLSPNDTLALEEVDTDEL